MFNQFFAVTSCIVGSVSIKSEKVFPVYIKMSIQYLEH